MRWGARSCEDEPNVFTNLYAAGSPHDYGNLDRFNRVVTSNWTNGITGGTDFYHVELTYDNLGNIMTAKDTIHADTSGVRRFDASYAVDAMSRLTRAEEGNWNGSSISTRRRDERWLDGSGNLALSQTGNWSRRRLDLNGDGDFVDSNELDDTGTFNAANEWLTRDTDSNSSVNYTLTHDAVGNMTDDGKSYKYVYDAFGRLVTVKNQSNATVAEYKYNGLGYRTGWHYDVTNAGGSAPDGTVDSNDPWYFFGYDERWRTVATYRGSDSTPKEQYVYHAAGARGLGGSSYIDSVVLRDRDMDDGFWWTVGDGDLEERRYYAQNWRADVSVILPSTGCDASVGPGILEWIKYSAYGVPQAFSMADYNRDGVKNSSDYNGSTGDFDVDYANSDPRADLNFDGGVTIDDLLLLANAASEAAGRGTLSNASVANRIGYAGYQWDPAVSVNHVRHRVYVPELGRWTRRDPLGYVDGMSVYEFVESAPVDSFDADGLACRRYNHCDGGPVDPPTGGNRRNLPAPPPFDPPGDGCPPGTHYVSITDRCEPDVQPPICSTTQDCLPASSTSTFGGCVAFSPSCLQQVGSVCRGACIVRCTETITTVTRCRSVTRCTDGTVIFGPYLPTAITTITRGHFVSGTLRMDPTCGCNYMDSVVAGNAPLPWCRGGGAGPPSSGIPVVR